MPSDDNRYYQTYYGIHVNDWNVNWGTYGTHKKILIKEFISDAASTLSSCQWQSSGSMFIYPHNIKKVYHIEGVVEGQVTFHAATEQSHVSDFRVSIYKITNDNTETELCSTGVVVVNDIIEYDSGWHVGEDIVYPFWIDVFDEAKELNENDRLGVKIEWDVNNESDASAWLMHDNDPNYEDFKITIPFII